MTLWNECPWQDRYSDGDLALVCPGHRGALAMGMDYNPITRLSSEDLPDTGQPPA